MAETPSSFFEEALEATIRAIATDKDIRVHFSKQGTSDFAIDYPNKEAALPTPAHPLTATTVQRLRGEADAAALSLRYHNAALHQTLAPKSNTSRDIFDRAEQMRVEALGVSQMAGVAQNLSHRLEYYLQRQGLTTVIDDKDVPVADIVALLIRKELTGLNYPESVKKLMNEWGVLLQARVKQDLSALQKYQYDQSAFAKQILALIEHLHLSEHPFEGTETEQSETDDAPPHQPEEEDTGSEAMAPMPGAKSSKTDRKQHLAPKFLSSGFQDDDEDSSDDESSSEYPSIPDFHHNQIPFHPSLYQPYTTQFDEIVLAEDLCSHDELVRLRQQLDMKLAHLKSVTNRLANRLQRTLLARQSRILELHKEEGVLDSGKLAQLVADPTYPLAYRWERVEDDYNTVITLLLDNSGSMRGRPITVAAMSADILARTLERCGIKVEILGFTSRDWKGGNSKKLWQKNGSLPNPGRLNDLRHIIYKSADQPWRRVRKNLGLMLREGILKENIDGEAILWAHDRLMARSEQRRILMVISDGAPVDDSTLSVNSSDCLENHLKEVIYTIENFSPVELLAIGIGHDVTRYYNHAVTIREVEQLSDTMFKELAELLET